MRLDAIVATDLAATGDACAHAEAIGCDGIMVPEVAHDPFLPVTLAAVSTTRSRLATGIAVAFARNPMNVAVVASDLQRLSDGRFALGLGTQIRPHITRRYSMPWSSPAARMREFVAAVRAIWGAWSDETPLDFRGEYYQHTLMTPMFSHGPTECGWPSIHLAAVGPVMTALAGEIADGLNTHGFTTPAYVREVTLPQLDVGLARSGRSREDLEVSVPVMVAWGRRRGRPTPQSDACDHRLLWVHAGIPPGPEHHGWGALGDELYTLSKRGEWQNMGTLIDDDVLHTFAVVGDARSVGTEIMARYGDMIDRIQLGVDRDDHDVAILIETLRFRGRLQKRLVA